MTNRSEYDRKRRERLIAASLCTQCGKAPAEAGRKLCRGCLDGFKIRWRERRELYKSAGHCLQCGVNDPAPGRKYCLDCLDKFSIGTERQREKKRASGICLTCGVHPAREGVTTCAECAAWHLSYNKARYRYREESAVCARCGHRSVAGTPYRTCAVCREKSRQAYRRKRDVELGIWGSGRRLTMGAAHEYYQRAIRGARPYRDLR